MQSMHDYTDSNFEIPPQYSGRAVIVTVYNHTISTLCTSLTDSVCHIVTTSVVLADVSEYLNDMMWTSSFRQRWTGHLGVK